MMLTFNPAELAQGFIEHMLNGIFLSGVLAVLAFVFLKAVGRKSSSTRFAVWFVVLLATVAMPWMGSLSTHLPPAVSSVPKSAILMPSSWAIYLFFIWAAIVTALLGRVVLGLWQVRRLRADCLEIDEASLDPALRRAVAESCSRQVKLYVSRSLRVPMATGFFRPMIVLPAWGLQELSLEEMQVILLHEAAHLRRWDDWTNLAQKALRALFFFHPVVWWIEGRLALEREMACDDLVVARTKCPRAYAQCLVALAEKSLGRRNLALAQAAVNRMRHTSLRIRQILDGKRGGTRVWKPAVVLAIASTMATFVFVGEAPRLVGFQSGPRKSQPTDSQPILTARASGVSNKAHPFMKTVMPSAARVRPGVKVVPAQRAASSPRYQVAAHEAFIQQVVERDRDDVIGNPFQAVTLVQPIPANTAGSGSESYQAAGLVATETVFLVLQDQTFNAAGNRLFHISVYWWTVVYPGMAPGNSQKVLNKSI